MEATPQLPTTPRIPNVGCPRWWARRRKPTSCWVFASVRFLPNGGERRKRKETERFRRFALADLLARDKVNLEIFWDDTLDDSDVLLRPARSRPRSWRI
jgi:hypothetical protein